MAADAAEITKLWERLNGDRGPWMSLWQDVTDFVLPNRADYAASGGQGRRRMNRVYDSTAIAACEALASGLHALLTSPTLRWFTLAAQDPRVDADDDARRWLDDTGDRMYSLFNGPKHNFASQSNELYLDLGSVGTAVMAVLESERNGVLFSTRHLRECVIAENEEDRVDTLIRKWTFTARQAEQQWGDAAGQKVLKAAADKPDTPFEFLHAVRPRRLRDVARSDARHKPFESVYVSLADKAVISESGFDEFPYMVPRFSKSTGEMWGRSPAMSTLPDIRSLNEMVRTVLMASQRAVDPPLNVPDDTYLFQINMTPGARNVYRAGSRAMIEPIKSGGDIPIGVEMISSLQARVKGGFYADWLAMPSDPSDPASAGKGVTATYTLQQRDEKMRLLSPMLARLQAEFLSPLIDRVFAIMWRRSVAARFGPGSMLAPPPPILAGMQLQVGYVSPIAVAQKSSQLDGIQRLVQTAVALGQVDQAAPRILDVEAILRITAADLSTPAAALKSKAQVQAETQAAAQAQQSAENQQALAAAASAAKDGAGAVSSLMSGQATQQQAAA